MTMPIIESLGHFPSVSLIDSSKKFTSFNDSEALMTADNSPLVWTTTKQVI